MRRKLPRLVAIVALAVTAVLGGSGAALGDDPTCDHPGGPPNGPSCPGDAGGAGCRGINTAQEHAPDEADAGLDLVRDILEPGNGDEDDVCGSGSLGG